MLIHGEPVMFALVAFRTRELMEQMVFVQPTTYALINITDFPFFVAPLNEIEHVHFERVFSSSKTCDLKIIMKVFIYVVVKI